jgi:hypothetical protein
LEVVAKSPYAMSVIEEMAARMMRENLLYGRKSTLIDGWISISAPPIWAQLSQVRCSEQPDRLRQSPGPALGLPNALQSEINSHLKSSDSDSSSSDLTLPIDWQLLSLLETDGNAADNSAKF